jgi:hypothetical protein
VGGWVLFIYHLHFYTYTLNYFSINFFGLPNFLFNLSNQKDHFMVSKKPSIKLDMFKSTCPI